MIAIEKEQLTIIKEILRKYFPQEEIRIFGIDIAIVGKKKIDLQTYSKVKEEIEESNVKYRVDLIDWASISKEFQKIIEEGYESI